MGERAVVNAFVLTIRTAVNEALLWSTRSSERSIQGSRDKWVRSRPPFVPGRAFLGQYGAKRTPVEGRQNGIKEELDHFCFYYFSLLKWCYCYTCITLFSFFNVQPPESSTATQIFALCGRNQVFPLCKCLRSMVGKCGFW
ncbi:hypothetical protein CDAR_198541 [Caerostris darwini]|uniref:Uncharacterized protein n=1 Tax=Caerostris darwini TaxID=1538125 RepID=A0AAV4W3S1_9ARAC|nr:hypothetical protein CDAR_198541 [Caerostris darwini]